MYYYFNIPGVWIQFLHTIQDDEIHRVKLFKITDNLGKTAAFVCPQKYGIIVKNALRNLTKTVICAKTSKTRRKEVFF